ncbi:LysR family transcriptional regulator [Psychromonas sp. psych-6C06]|uniref:LysR family transcriptional regulator n=1 Tax=Psychromonas sp. psych-6C06 TaxID=2058089 RepID=UPI000C328A9F|nr:LysR family transcriptional regulator [Psychromonas sp. psych-6C06]PKF63788.1 LysR family transcriptional regulator [Psychromonas sp. psych-6C06]
MKIDLLKTFLEVSRTLHFRIASENLFITQSAVSARIKLLEDELGVLLFDRTKKHLKLTPEGHRLIKHANELIFMWQKTKQDVGITSQHSTQLVIGSMSTIWDIVLQNWLQKIHRNYEDISLLTNTYSPTELRKKLLNRVIDIAFMFEPIFSEQLLTEKVTSVPLHLVTTDPEQATNLDDISDFVFVDYGDSVNAQYLREFDDAPEARHYMSQPMLALNFILNVGGAAYLPRQICFSHIQNNNLYLVQDAPIFSREIFVNYLAKSQKVDVIEQTINLFPQIEV